MARKRHERKHGQPNNDNRGPPAPRVRSHSTGEYTRPPSSPRPIDVSSTHILDNHATKTLLAILRAHWPEGVFSFYEAPKSFWPTVLSEFRRYYCYRRGVSNAEGDAVVKQHVSRTMTQALYEERSRAQIRAEREGTSLVEQCPTYFKLRVWKSFCNHWRKRSFKRKSDTNKLNREKLRVVHTTGAKCFNKLKEELTREYNRPPTFAEFWERGHKLKYTDEWASKGAKLIAERMQSILDTTESSPDWESGISVLLAVQGPIKKNRILGLPRVRANTIIPRVQQPQRTQRTRSTNKTLAEPLPQPRVNSVVPSGRQPRGTLIRRTQPKSSNQETGSGVGPSRSGPGVPNEMLIELVKRTLVAIRSDPSFEGAKHPSQEQLHLLAQEVIGGSGLSLSPQVYEVMRTEMVRLMVSIFEDVFQQLLERRPVRS
ncbi:hypothetical protein LXL04_019518 [Taraxacum kok-saghyz]